MKTLFIIILLPVVALLIMLESPAIYILVLIIFFGISFYVANKNFETNDIIIRSGSDASKKETEYTLIKKSPVLTHNEQPMVIVDDAFIIRSSNQAFKNFCGANPDGKPISISLRSPT